MLRVAASSISNVRHDRRVLPHGTSVEAGAKDDDLPDIRDEAASSSVSSKYFVRTLTISRTCRKPGSNASRRLPRLFAQEQLDDGVPVEGRRLGVLFRSEFRHHEGRAAHVFDRHSECLEITSMPLQFRGRLSLTSAKAPGVVGVRPRSDPS